MDGRQALRPTVVPRQKQAAAHDDEISAHDERQEAADGIELLWALTALGVSHLRPITHMRSASIRLRLQCWREDKHTPRGRESGGRAGRCSFRLHRFILKVPRARPAPIRVRNRLHLPSRRNCTCTRLQPAPLHFLPCAPGCVGAHYKRHVSHSSGRVGRWRERPMLTWPQLVSVSARSRRKRSPASE